MMMISLHVRAIYIIIISIMCVCCLIKANQACNVHTQEEEEEEEEFVTMQHYKLILLNTNTNACRVFSL